MNSKYHFKDSNSVAWEKHRGMEGVETKKLCSANDQIMELYRFSPDTLYPDHLHIGPEFVYLLEGSARVDGKWIQAGWSSAAETGTLDKEFLSGESGCVFLSVYTKGSKYV
ncbi:MAG: hypothetical protein ACI9GW_001026 [Halieaceae bacterium]|jgi:hypothetical protein